MTDTTDDAVTTWDRADRPGSWMVKIGGKPIGMIHAVDIGSRTLYQAIDMSGKLVRLGASWECDLRLREIHEQEQSE